MEAVELYVRRHRLDDVGNRMVFNNMNSNLSLLEGIDVKSYMQEREELKEKAKNLPRKSVSGN